jgi:hypothetical protein
MKVSSSLGGDMIIIKKLFFAGILFIVLSFPILSQSSETMDLSIDKEKIENMLYGSWSIQSFSLPGRMELGWEDNNLKASVSITSTESYVDLSDNGSGVFWGGYYGDEKFLWEIVPPFSAFEPFTMQVKYKLQSGAYSDPVFYEIIIFDYETMIVNYIYYDGDNPVPMSELWKKVSWDYDTD